MIWRFIYSVLDLFKDNGRRFLVVPRQVIERNDGPDKGNNLSPANSGAFSC